MERTGKIKIFSAAVISALFILSSICHNAVCDELTGEGPDHERGERFAEKLGLTQKQQEELNKQREEEKREITPHQSSRENRIGVSVMELSREEKADLGRGVKIASVAPNSVAHDAGLRKEDIILQINQSNVKHVADFKRKIAALPEGKKVPVLIHREGADQFVVISLPEDQ